MERENKNGNTNLDPSPISKFITHNDSLSRSYVHFPVARACYPLPVHCFSNIGY